MSHSNVEEPLHCELVRYRPRLPAGTVGKLVPQCIMTLNLPLKSIINPKLSAYSQMEGAFGFNKIPLAPVGMKVIFHKKTESRPTWSPHAVEGWYLGPAMHHYQ